MIDIDLVRSVAEAHGYKLVADITSISNYGKVGKKIRSAFDVYECFEIYKYSKVEYLLMLTLNGASEIIGKYEVSKGTLNQSLVHPREVFINAIRDQAAGIIIAHNHPSEQCEPSSEDKKVTKRLQEAGKIIGIEIIDHVIIAGDEYYSFLEQGEMQ